MKKLTDFIVDHCFIVLFVVVLIAGTSAFVAQNVKINHDIMEYMPESSETSQGLRVMDEEFKDVTTSGYMMMFENLAEEEKPEVKEYIQSVKGVKSVGWDETENYNREKDGKNYTLYDVTVEGEADANVAANAYHEIHDHFKNATENDKEKYVFYEKGDVAMDNGTVLNITVIIIAVLAALVIITIMSDSFIEPILYLVSILIAVVINKGTNIIFPSVSHVTDAITAVLQMALSMDYSIMLAHRYRQERAKEHDKKAAMKKALSYSFSSISASSVTTIVGLIVLVFMSFTIGRDMGFVLSKGVFLSLVSIFTTLPAFLLFFDKWIMHSKKKAPTIKMNLLGNAAFSARHFALPVFAVILVGAMILKGNVGIEYTSTANDQIKDVFEETNQIAMIYKNEDEAKIAKVCRDYNGKAKVKEVLCFSNTIGEELAYDEMKEKADDLGSKMDVEDYLIKTLYYHYFNPDEKHALTLSELVTFIQKEVEDNPNFKDDVNGNTKTQINRLSNFVVKTKVESEKTLNELAEILEINANDLKKIFVLYASDKPETALGRAVTNSKMTLNHFVDFINNVVLKNPTYAKEIDANGKAKIKKVTPFLNKNTINKKMTNEELSELLGVPADKIEDIFKYEAYLAYRDEEGRTLEQIEALKPQTKLYIKSQVQSLYIAQANQMRAAAGYPEMVEAEVAGFLASKDQEIDAIVDAKIQEAEDEIEAGLTLTAKNTKNTPVELVNFVIKHQNDGKMKGKISDGTKSELKLAQTVMNAVNNNKAFSQNELANTFSLNKKQLRTLYSLDYFENKNKSPKLSMKELIRFINSRIIGDEKYGSAIEGNKASRLETITDLMERSLKNEKFTAKQAYNALRPLSAELKSELVDMLYFYHGSLYDYDKDYEMSLEQFVNYLHGTILKDERFDKKIDNKKRDMINDANEKITDAKKLLVGKNHSRAVFNTTLEAENDETFEFIKNLKEAVNKNGASAYIIGTSPMAYEMSHTFGDEMNLITILTMASIFVVVAITFKSIIIPLILVLIIQTAVWITMSILALTGSNVYFIAIIIVQAILMGATIDYAILYTSYYLEHRKKQKDSSKKEYYQNIKKAIVDSYNKSIHTIITSASVLVIVTLIVGEADKGSAIAAKICTTVSEGTFCSAILILLILPAIIASCDKIIIRRKK